MLCTLFSSLIYKLYTIKSANDTGSVEAGCVMRLLRVVKDKLADAKQRGRDLLHPRQWTWCGARRCVLRVHLAVAKCCQITEGKLGHNTRFMYIVFQHSTTLLQNSEIISSKDHNGCDNVKVVRRTAYRVSCQGCACYLCIINK